jgi:hypothetical protein
MAASAPPPPPPPPPPPFSPQSTATPPPAAPVKKRMSPMIIAVVAVVVIVIVVIAALWAVGFGPFAKSNTATHGPNGTGTGETFSSAASTAAPTTSSVSGGPWTLIGGAGVLVANSFTVNATEINRSASEGTCGSHLLPGASSLTTFPGTSSSPSSGDLNAWVVWYANSTDGVLEVAVFGGTATPVLTQTIYGGDCSSGAISKISLPTDYIDSPSPAAVAYSAGGSAFIAAHPAGWEEMPILVPAVSFTGGSTNATWEVAYTDCNNTADTGTTYGGAPVAEFTASINATSGKLITTTNQSYACASSNSHPGGSKPTFSSSFEFQLYQENNSPPLPTTPYWNNGTLVNEYPPISASFDLNELTMSIVNNTTKAPVSTTGYALYVKNDSSGAILSSYDFSTNTWNNTAISITSISYDEWDDLVLVTPTNQTGNTIIATASSSAPVTGSISDWLGSPAI